MTFTRRYFEFEEGSQARHTNKPIGWVLDELPESSNTQRFESRVEVTPCYVPERAAAAVVLGRGRLGAIFGPREVSRGYFTRCYTDSTHELNSGGRRAEFQREVQHPRPDMISGWFSGPQGVLPCHLIHTFPGTKGRRLPY